MTRRNAELSSEELERETGEPLPAREAMSTIDLGDAALSTMPMPVDSVPTDPEAGEEQTWQVERPWWNPPPLAE